MRDLFFWDIESAGKWKTYNHIDDPKAKELFDRKYEKWEWENKYGNIETAYLENAPIFSTFGKICCISYGWWNGSTKVVKSIYGEDEKDIVTKFNQVLIKVSEKNFDLCGFRIVNYDIPWLLHKLHSYDIKPAEILSIYDKKPWEIRVIDISELWKQKFAYSSTFDEVCYELCVKSPKTDMNGSEVHSAFWNGDYDKIKTYCESDVSALFDVSKKMRL